MHCHTPHRISDTTKSSVLSRRHKRIPHCWPWNEKLGYIHFPWVSLPKLIQPSNMHAHLKDIMAKAIKQKGTGRMDKILRHANIKFLMVQYTSMERNTIHPSLDHHPYLRRTIITSMEKEHCQEMSTTSS